MTMRSRAVTDIHELWLAVPLTLCLVLMASVAYMPIHHYEPGVRHSLPAPYVPQCYAVEWRSGEYCEIRPVKRHYNN